MDSSQNIFVLHLLNRQEELDHLNSFLQQVSNTWQIPEGIILPINLALEEVFTNIIKYGYQDEFEHDIEVVIERFDDSLRIRVTDDGKPFDPLNTPSPDTSVQANEREVGGLGILLIRQMMDVVDYNRSDKYNVLTMEKKLHQEPD